MTTKCRTCHGEGVIEKDGKLIECFCAFVRRRASSVPTNVRTATVLPEHIDHPLTNMQGQHVHIVAYLDDVRAIMKVMLFKHPRLFFKFTTDAVIKDVHVGSMARAAKSADYSGDDVYNNLRDLVDPPDLLIIHLGALGTRNKTAAAALLEALNHRIDARKPVWTLSNADPHKAFTRASPAWSEDVESTIRDFRKVRIGRITPVAPPVDEEAEPIFADPRPSQVASAADATPAESVARTGGGLGDGRKDRRDKPQRPRPVEGDEPQGELSMYGSGATPAKRRGKKMEH